MLLMTISAFGSETETPEENNTGIETQAVEPVVDTITLDSQELWDGNVPADLSWKTKQDKGKWIEELGIAKEATSLLLIVNSLDKEDPNALPAQTEQKMVWPESTDTASSAKNLDLTSRGFSSIEKEGKSQLLYLSKNTEGEWVEILSTGCVISGGQTIKKEELYGVYKPKKSIGTKENPGSLLPYHTLLGNEYWTLNPEEDGYGDLIVSSEPRHKMAGALNLVGTKVFFNYGMIIETEMTEENQQEETEYSALLLGCLHMESRMDLFAGIQIPETSLRMLLQCVDENTCIIIVGSADELTDIQNKDEQVKEE